MPMNHRLMVPRQTTHPEALAWRAAVIANGGSVSGTTLTAVDRFVKSIYTAGIRDRFYRLNLFCGTGLASALVPLFRSQSFGGTSFGGTTDTNVNFVSGDYNETGSSCGLTQSGTKYLNTGFPANTIAAGSAHMGIGLRTTTNSTGFRSMMGAFNGASNSFEFAARSGTATINCAYFTRFGTASDTLGDNIGTTGAALTAGNLVAAWPTLFRNGVASGATATTSQDYPSAHSFYVFAANQSNVNPINYCVGARIDWYSIGLTMTSAQAVLFQSALAAFQSSLSRS